ncbi:MAG: 6-bladed beta-propeller [Balneolaceae bacterium]|nr:6-bladed beta-propeller [Balneolaceae bacterium]
MVKRASILSVGILCLLLFLSCKRETDIDTADSSTGDSPEVTIADSGETHLLRDDLKPLDTVMMIEAVGDSALIVVDAQPSVGYFANHVMTRTYGRIGRGPCEYLEISNIDTNSDSLFVLDSAQAKIIAYNLNTAECLGETSHPILQRAHYLERLDGSYLTGRIYYRVGTPDSTVLLKLVHDNGTVEDLSLTKGEVNPVPVRFPFDLQGINFARYGNRIYAAFPLSGMLAKLDLETHKISTYSMDLVLNRKAFEEATSDSGDAGDLINGGMVEIVRGVFAAKNWVGVSTIRFHREEPNIEKFHVFTPERKLIRSLNYQDNPSIIRGNELLIIDATGPAESRYGYQVTYRQISVY